MGIYDISNKARWKECDDYYIALDDKKGNMSAYFVGDFIDTLDTDVIFATAPCDVPKNLFSKYDFFEVLTGVPLFSQRFKDRVGSILSNEMKLIDCIVKLDGEEFLCYAGKILNYVNFVDYEKSGYMKSPVSGDPPILIDPFYIDPNTDFYIAKDSKVVTHYAVSEKFVSLVKSHKLAIEFFKLA